MVLKIVWSSLAIRTYADNIKYLEEEWTEKEVNKLLLLLKRN
jgi:hypothetical protein